MSCSNPDRNSTIDQLALTKLEPQNYVVEYRGVPVGTYETSGFLNEKGEYEYSHVYTYASTNNLTLQAVRRLRFDSKPPYSLQNAESVKYSQPDSVPYESLAITRANGSLTVELQGSDPVTLNEDFTLNEYFGLESWLITTEPPKGSELTLISLDLGNATLSPNTWFVTDSSSEIVAVRSLSQVESVFEKGLNNVQLKSSSDTTGLMLRRAEGETESLSAGVPLTSNSLDLRVPLKGQLERPRQLVMLRLKATFSNGNPGPWQDLLSSAQTLQIGESATRFTSGSWESKTRTESDNASSSSRLMDLAAKAIEGLSEENEKISALVRFTHDFVDYQAASAPSSIFTTLKTRKGDCSDIANLLRALATSSGLQARTVYGLVYDEASHTFQIHAWNEFRLSDRSYRSVDATWDQPYADATHIEFPDAYLHEILYSLEQMSLQVIDLEYAKT